MAAMTGVTGERRGGDLTPSGKAITLKRAENLLGVFPRAPPGSAFLAWLSGTRPPVASSGRKQQRPHSTFPWGGGPALIPRVPSSPVLP